RSAARRSAPSAPASPSWSACRPASIGAMRRARRRGSPRASRNRGPDPSGIEKRGPRATPSVTAMDITIPQTYLPPHHPDPSLPSPRDRPACEARHDAVSGGLRWTTVAPPHPPGPPIAPPPPAVDPGITDDERRTIVEMMAKGTYASINLATKDLDGTFDRLQ